MHLKTVILAGAFYLGIISGLSVIAGFFALFSQASDKNQRIQAELEYANHALAESKTQLEAYLSQDQYQRNQTLNEEIEAIQSTYKKTASTYEDLIELRLKQIKTNTLDTEFAAILSLLATRNYASASSKLAALNKSVEAENAKLAASFSIPAAVPVSNKPPDSGYSRQQVQLDIGTYMVSIVSADLNSTRVVVDTASSGDCGNNCPVTALGDYVSRSGAFAGINGPYFCPAEYPSCANKTNTFDTLIMNKNKVYFNSDNNVYSSVSAVIFSGNSARFVGKTAEWGRSTDVDSVIAAQPMLVSNGTVVFGGDGDPKKGSKGTRGFIGASGSTVYIGHVHNATVAESARVLQALGIQNALNLDGGGSVALWANGGYKVGPGRNLPLGIVLVRK
jgi:exopolysaccharide biosynthesis protein